MDIRVTIPFVVTRLKSISFDLWFWLSARPAQTFDVVALQEYVTLMKCHPCHSRLVPLRAEKLSRVSLFTPCARIRILEREATGA